MTSSVKTASGKSNPATGKVAGKNRQSCLWWPPVLQVLQVRFKHDFVGEIRLRTGRDPSVIQRWKTCRHAPDGEALTMLINSDIGDLVLKAITRNNDHAWARSFRRTLEIAKLRNLQAETERRLAALEKGVYP